MAYVPTVELNEGMVLSKNIYNSNGNNILSKGETLTLSRIQRLHNFKIQGVYIANDYNHEENNEILQEKIKKKALRIIKGTFVDTESKQQIEKEKIEMLMNVIEEVLDNLLNNNNLILNINDIKIFDEYTYFHSVNVMVISLIVGIGLELNKKELSSLGLAAILHDIGKVLIPLKILNKAGKLTNEEFLIIQQHPLHGYNIVKNIDIITEDVKRGIYEHHEKYNGTGYPCNKKGEEISLFGRIISIADVYDAITSDRVYRKGMLMSEAIEFIIANSETVFDKKIVKVFMEYVMPYPVGTHVKLSNNMVGIVIKNNKEISYRPVLKIVLQNERVVDNLTVDLFCDPKYLNVVITNILA